MTRTTILVTGASSGIGAALAKAYASPGAHLILWGRNAQRLDQSARDCRALGAAVQTLQFDLRDAGAIAGHIETYDDATPIDIAILNAGLGGTASAKDAAESADRAFEVATVNFTAQVVGANAVAACMAKRGRGKYCSDVLSCGHDPAADRADICGQQSRPENVRGVSRDKT
jgi:short-subunit dehydrogenase